MGQTINLRELVAGLPRSTRWILAGGAVTSLVVFIVTAASLEERPSEVDLEVERSVEEEPHRLLFLPMKALAVASGTRGSFWILLAVGVFFAFRRSDWRPALMVGVAFVGVVASTAVLKTLFDRPAPEDWAAGELSGSAFPSGHMAQAVAVWGAVALVIALGRTRRERTLVAACAVLLTGGAALSRLILGAHWLTDVIAGLALGVLWLALVAMLAHVIGPRERPRGKLPEPRPEMRPTVVGRAAGSADVERRSA